jgi:ubiquinone/menaquinone biosynthesis C-methylase UbiE
VLRLADAKAGELVLDIGTGTGLLACKVAPEVAPQEVVAIDLADGAIARATYRAAGLGIRSIRFEMMDVRNIVYRGGLFDAVVSNLGIPAIGFERCFVEVARVLKPTGRFVFSEWGDFADPAFDAFLGALERHRPREPSKKLAELRAATEYFRDSRGWKDLRSPEKVTAALKAAGFRRVEVTTEIVTTPFEPPEAFVDFRLSWGANEAELAAAGPEAMRAFTKDIGEELRSIAGGDRLEEDWLLHFYDARPR